MVFPTNPIYKLYKERGVDSKEIIGVTKYLGIEGHYLDIPLSEDNTDYQEYLAWVAEGNTAEAADGLTWDDIRAKRNGILSSTDWTMTTGATVDQAQWAAYRLSLIHI